MPEYRFRNKETLEETTIFLSISEVDKYARKNKHLEWIMNGAPSLGDSIQLGIKKPDSQFREMLKTMKKNNIRSTIHDH